MIYVYAMLFVLAVILLFFLFINKKNAWLYSLSTGSFIVIFVVCLNSLLLFPFDIINVRALNEKDALAENTYITMIMF